MTTWIKDALELVKDALPASVGSAATSAVGSVLVAPTWLVGIGQAAVVVYFTVKAIDKRMARLHERQNRVEGLVETLGGRLDGLACRTPVPGKRNGCVDCGVGHG